jgi:hypothetical protein
VDHVLSERLRVDPQQAPRNDVNPLDVVVAIDDDDADRQLQEDLLRTFAGW